jgi:hypothetical protein
MLGKTSNFSDLDKAATQVISEVLKSHNLLVHHFLPFKFCSKNYFNHKLSRITGTRHE